MTNAYYIYDKNERYWTGAGFSKDGTKVKLFYGEDHHVSGAYKEFNGDHPLTYRMRGIRKV